MRFVWYEGWVFSNDVFCRYLFKMIDKKFVYSRGKNSGRGFYFNVYFLVKNWYRLKWF